MIRGRTESRGSWRVDGIGAAICLGMCAAAYFAGIAPLLSRHEHYAQQRALLESQREKAADSAIALLRVKHDRDLGRAKLMAAPLKLRPAQQVNQRLSQLSSLAADAGTTLDELQPGRVTTGSRYDTYAIRFAGTGTYTSATALLYRIRTAFPDMGIIGMEISGRPSDPKGTAKFQFELLWYTAPATRGTAVSADVSR